jgi:hypothetical protein
VNGLSRAISAVAVAALSRDDPKLPVAFAVLADAGANQGKLAEVLGRSTKQAEDAGAKVSQESFQGRTLHVLQFPAPKNKDQGKDQEKKEQEKETPPPPVVWTQSESLFFLGSDVEVVKDLVATTRWPPTTRSSRPRPSSMRARRRSSGSSTWASS